MNRSTPIISVTLCGLLIALCAGRSMSATLNPDTVFTLRSASNAGPATSMSSTSADNGFTGTLTNYELASIVDRTYLEFDMSGFGGAVLSATLDFALSGGDSGDVISMGWYDANGIAELADWSTPQTAVTTFNADVGAHSFDITGLINSNINTLNFIGFGFAIDAWPNQAFFNTGSIAINFESTAVPLPAAAWLLGSGLLGLIGIPGIMKRNKQGVNKAIQ